MEWRGREKEGCLSEEEDKGDGGIKGKSKDVERKRRRGSSICGGMRLGGLYSFPGEGKPRRFVGCGYGTRKRRRTLVLVLAIGIGFR